MVRRFKTHAAAALLFLAAVPTAQAQSLGRLLACADIPRAEERLQCYDAAARTAIGVGSQPAQSVPSTQSSDALDARARDLDLREQKIRLREAEAANKANAPTSAPVASVARAAQSGGSDDGALAKREAALAEREAALAQREARVTAKVDADDEEATLFGIPIPFTKKDPLNSDAALENQVVTRDEDGTVEAISSRIMEASTNADGRLTFVLANGQVWRQMDGVAPYLKGTAAKPDIASISRGALGSFTLKLNNSNRLLKVRRVDNPKKKP